MTWLLAVIFRPLGAVAFFALALVISRLLWPLIPAGRVRSILYDRSLQKRHPWKTFLLFAFAFYGMILLVARLVR